MITLLLPIIYLSFISLGLPDSLLGSAWPSIFPDLGVPVSYAGIISMLIAGGTIVSSLLSDRLTHRFGPGKITAVSVMLTAVALLGFSFSGSFIMLCVMALPYGLGAGSIDACLNNYVAVHYSSRHMSWLHCMWGVGASIGPYIMGAAITGGFGWNSGYRIIAYIQIALTAMLFLSLPLWKASSSAATSSDKEREVLPLKKILVLPGVKEVLASFFCYCALEQTAGLWAASYLVLRNGVAPETAASLASLFFLGMTVGRAINGFLAMKFSDSTMIHVGSCVILVGIIAVALGGSVTLLGIILVGLGAAPIYPSIIHSTPALFGADKSQAIIGVQMAAAYTGTCLMPPVFGLIAQYLSVAWFPAFLFLFLALMVLTYRKLLKICG